MTAIPATLSLLVAWKVMRLPALLALGAITGQQCSTLGVTAVQQAAGNATLLMARLRSSTPFPMWRCRSSGRLVAMCLCHGLRRAATFPGPGAAAGHRRFEMRSFHHLRRHLRRALVVCRAASRGSWPGPSLIGKPTGALPPGRAGIRMWTLCQFDLHKLLNGAQLSPKTLARTASVSAGISICRTFP